LEENNDNEKETYVIDHMKLSVHFMDKWLVTGLPNIVAVRFIPGCLIHLGQGPLGMHR
jgi:hypothetical protein